MAEEPIDCASLIVDGWFMEKNPQWAGQANSLQVKEVLLHKRTKFQDLMVFQSTDWGKVLVLDGVIQLTERDESSYQEMMSHLPLFAHPSPKKVLIVGGGDGGVLREAVKHSCVEQVTHCEIDAGVIEAAKEFFPSLSKAFSNPKAKVIVGDGVAFVAEAPSESYDVVIVDSSDPVGPAEGLFSPKFYESVLKVLKPGGVLCAQGECLWVHADLIEEMIRTHGKPFASAEYASIQVPTYPSGQIGAFLVRKAWPGAPAGWTPSCREPRRDVPEGMELNYYSSEMHRAAFALPAFLKRRLLRAEDPESKRARTAH